MAEKKPKSSIASKIKNNRIMSAGIAIAMVAALALAVTLFSSGEGRKGLLASQGSEPIVITELMSDNFSTIKDDNGNYSDWIEICNVGKSRVSLSGYCLSDDALDPAKWEFPDLYLEAGEYLVVFCSGQDRFDTKTGAYHTSFRLSSKGEDISLTNSRTTQTYTVSFGRSQPDVSFGLIVPDGGDEAVYKWLDQPTPGRKNTGNYADSAFKLPSLSISGVVISEYMTENRYTIYDSDGDYNDWLELYNGSDSDVDLSGCVLSDIESDVARWFFPDGTVIGKGEYMLVFLSGKDKAENGELHTSFRIGNTDTVIMLYDKASRMVDMTDIVALSSNVSRGRNEKGEWVYFTLPTPGKPNNNSGVSEPPLTLSLSGGVYISEVCAAAKSDQKSEPGWEDWIELHNSSDGAVNLSGCRLAKSIDDENAYVFDDVSIEPDGYAVVYANGEGASEGQARFRLKSSGDSVLFISPDGRVLDEFETGKLRIGATSGRKDDGTDRRVFFSEPTPGERNSDNCFSGYAPKPEILSDGGYCKSGTKVEITVPEGTVVRYTDDGSEPTADSTLYEGKITVDSSVTLTARAFSDSLLPSDPDFVTFITEDEYTLPVVSISIDPEEMFGKDHGIYYPDSKLYGSFDGFKTKNYERAARFEYFVDGERVLELPAGIRLSGTGSRRKNQRALAIMLRDCYGVSSVNYPFFTDSGHNTSASIVLRAGGQDQGYTFLRDNFCARVIRNASDNVLTSDGQPVIVYINGRYWGLYEVREKINEEFLEINGHVSSKENVDIILNNDIARAGDNKTYNELCHSISSIDMTTDESFEYVSQYVDIESSIDYTVFETFFRNLDYTNGRVYRDKENGKWRWIVVDLDMTMREGADKPVPSTFRTIIGYDRIINRLLQNEKYRKMLLDRYAELLGTSLRADKLLETLDGMSAQIEPEIERNYERWYEVSYPKWQNQMDALRVRIGARRGSLLPEIQDYFELSDEEMTELFGGE